MLYNFLKKKIGPDCSKLIIYDVYNYDTIKLSDIKIFKYSYEYKYSFEDHLFRQQCKHFDTKSTIYYCGQDMGYMPYHRLEEDEKWKEMEKLRFLTRIGMYNENSKFNNYPNLHDSKRGINRIYTKYVQYGKNNIL